MAKYEAGDEILFQDIQKGDRIRRTTTYADGGTSIYEGIAFNGGNFYWDTLEGLTVAFSDDDDDRQILVELVERTKPKLPHVPGSIIKAKKVRDSVGEFILFRTDDDSWRSALRITDKSYGGGYYWHPEDQIEDWVEMDLVAKKS